MAQKETKKGAAVLIIEDEKPLAHALALKFQHEGFSVDIAETGTAGLERASNGKYALILLDLILPEIDGFAILETLKGKGSKTPVIILSNLGQAEDKERAVKLGAKEYFVKANTPIADILKKAKTVIK